ncbi:uncharacterized protein ACNLHF_016290 isoform 1-T4 [Anomaloglossus baeobatrachus]
MQQAAEGRTDDNLEDSDETPCTPGTSASETDPQVNSTTPTEPETTTDVAERSTDAAPGSRQATAQTGQASNIQHLSPPYQKIYLVLWPKHLEVENSGIRKIYQFSQRKTEARVSGSWRGLPEECSSLSDDRTLRAAGDLERMLSTSTFR